MLNYNTSLDPIISNTPSNFKSTATRRILQEGHEMLQAKSKKFKSKKTVEALKLRLKQLEMEEEHAVKEAELAKK
jgi:hypothetical protein